MSKWSCWATVSSEMNGSSSGAQQHNLRYRGEFQVANDEAAKIIILNHAQALVSQFPDMTGRRLFICAAPYGRIVEGARMFNARRVVRLRTGYSNNRKILEVKNPNEALVQGRGVVHFRKSNVRS